MQSSLQTLGTNYKITLAYVGTRYFGWQKTESGPSIEESLEKAFFQTTRQTPTLQAASRTDRGVHAERQIINFFSLSDFDQELIEALNSCLPHDISILSVEKVSPFFHPTLDAVGKEYHYFICNKAVQDPFHRLFSWHVPAPLSCDKMQRTVSFFCKKADFSALTNQRKSLPQSRICRLSSLEIVPLPENRLKISLIGDHFLYKMARNIVGTLVYVGLGKLRLADIPSLLESKDRTRAGITAPAWGLHLKEVFYRS